MTKPRLIICLMENNCNVAGLNINCICAAVLAGERETLSCMLCV